MNVGDLIEKLRQLPDDMVVVTDGGRDNSIAEDLTLYRIPAHVERTHYGSVYVDTYVRRGRRGVEDVALLANWGQLDDSGAVEL